MPIVVYSHGEQIVVFIGQSKINPLLEWLVRAEEPFLSSRIGKWETLLRIRVKEMRMDRGSFIYGA